ncbi:hypothetical protein XELAEV_18020133mg [Xenopus laevis]|uniref:Uncharacterized protein n=1 Tax=Xenopus laevis TaxID=8355 RepID=A0A974HQE3_XENLA|nr:hypothetical protein XELAEV_18020133mg [Xenopus laevis]
MYSPSPYHRAVIRGRVRSVAAVWSRSVVTCERDYICSVGFDLLRAVCSMAVCPAGGALGYTQLIPDPAGTFGHWLQPRRIAAGFGTDSQSAGPRCERHRWDS